MQFTFILCEYDDLWVGILLDFKGIKFKLEIQKVWLSQFSRSSSSILLQIQIFYFTRPCLLQLASYLIEIVKNKTCVY